MRTNAIKVYVNFSCSMHILPSVFQYGFMAKEKFLKTAGFCSVGHI